MNFFSFLSLSVILFILLGSCSRSDVPETLARGGKVGELLTIALNSDTDAAKRFAALEPLISLAKEAGETYWLNNVLGRVINEYPGDPYGAYYLMAMADTTGEGASEKLALDYLRRLLKNYPDLEIENRSMHLIALKEIANRTDDALEAVKMREEMQRRFSSRIDIGRNQYYLAEEYRKTGNWNRIYEAYEMFLESEETKIPGVNGARRYAAEVIQFHKSRKSWTMENLDDLVKTIQYAIRTKNASTLKRYQSGNFFMMNWSQETSDSFTHIPMTIGSFLNNSVKYRNTIEEFSNDREAFLWTANWTWKIPTWYLYFRRIDYPANPEIHGQWEWAGIYFGERL